mgnify:CR=1 FL=1
MKVLLLYDYPPPPGGLATQGEHLRKGLKALGVDVKACHLESSFEKRWYYKWFEPDVVLGVGYWGHTPHIVLHPLQYNQKPIPWLVADGVVLNYQTILNNLPLILVTSNWVKERFERDGVYGEQIEILPVGTDTDAFIPYEKNDSKVKAVRESLKIDEDELTILTVGGDAASKGAREVMEALSLLGSHLPKWRYVLKVWPQPRTKEQTRMDLELAESLGIKDKLVISDDRISRDFMPYLLSSCDIYAGPSRIEGFGMVQVEAGACGKPVIGIKAMGLLDTIIEGENGFLAKIKEEIKVEKLVVGEEHGFPNGTVLNFDPPKVIDYRADVEDIAKYLEKLILDEELRSKMGENGRKRAVEVFDFRVVARKFVDIVKKRGLVNE